MQQHRAGARAEYRQQQDERVRGSVSLAARYGTLKSLTVDLEHFDPEGLLRGTHIRYVVNLAHAKSVFRFRCPNNECIGGDFDLTNALASAVAARRRTVRGELTCRGWRNKEGIDHIRCHHILRYKFRLGY